MLRMVSLTTTQRDLLRQLLAATAPASTATLGAQLHLTPRQVQYGLREVKPWLSRRNLILRHTPGVGVELLGEPTRKHALLAELSLHARIQLILTADQRQQLLTLRLLSSDEPTVLGQFQHDLAVARATVLKDLEVAEGWIQRFGLAVARRQHRGCWVTGPELARRQALAVLLWGDLPCERPLLHVRAGPTIEFALAHDAALLPVVALANQFIRSVDLSGTAAAVAQTETELGGQFNEDALTWLTLMIAVQSQRVAAGQHLGPDDPALRWAETQPIWPVAVRLSNRLWPTLAAHHRLAETAILTAQLCATPRDEPWQASFDSGPALRALIATMQQQIAAHDALPVLAEDEQLRAGLEAHILPACIRARFGLWSPRRVSAPERDASEQQIVVRLAETTRSGLGATLPEDAADELVLLLRAAVVRARPERARRVLVVCPSGMATTQLLVARLRARLPRLGTYEVLTLRALTPERLAEADLIISTVPLELATDLPVVQVHPMLRSEDIAALTQWLT